MTKHTWLSPFIRENQSPFNQIEMKHIYSQAYDIGRNKNES